MRKFNENDWFCSFGFGQDNGQTLLKKTCMCICIKNYIAGISKINEEKKYYSFS